MLLKLEDSKHKKGLYIKPFLCYKQAKLFNNALSRKTEKAEEGGLKLKKFSIKTLALSLLFLLVIPVPVLAASGDDNLSNVTFHDRGLDEEQSRALRAGVARLWAFVSPYATEQGLDKFPRTTIWGFSNHSGVSRNCSVVSASGCAYPGRAYVTVPSYMSISTSAHEAMHLVQFAIGGSDLGSQCIAEGAADYYGDKSVVGQPGTISSFKNLVNDIKTVLAGKDNLPALGSMSSRSGFNRIDTTIAYPTCFLAFDLLMQIEGGEEQGGKAYFQYLSELRRSDWRTAFNRVFGENFERFEKRFELYFESGYENWKFPAEIAQEKFMDELTSCSVDGLWATKVCIK